MTNKSGLRLHKEKLCHGHVSGDVNDVSVAHAPLGLNGNRIPVKFTPSSNIIYSQFTGLYSSSPHRSLGPRKCTGGYPQRLDVNYLQSSRPLVKQFRGDLKDSY